MYTCKIMKLCIVAVSFLTLPLQVHLQVAEADQSYDMTCHDWEGESVEHGTSYVPNRNDPCHRCICEHGFGTMCRSVQCSPPSCEFLEEVEGECCEFNCIKTSNDYPDPSDNITNFGEPRLPDHGLTRNTANMGLRLVASTITSFLILALLLFMVHRLRQRRTLMMMRRLNSERMEDDTVAYMPQIDQVDIGMEFPPYEDPPPPYSPPKPQFPNIDAPPPYEENPSGLPEYFNNNNGYLNRVMDPIDSGIIGRSHRHSGCRDSHSVGSSTRSTSVETNHDNESSTATLNIRGDQRVECSEHSSNSESMPGSLEECNNLQDIRQNINYTDSDSDEINFTESIASNRHQESSRPSHSVLSRVSDNPLQSSQCNRGTNVGHQSDRGCNKALAYIKRSDSIEIRRDSNSPRNSFYKESTSQNGLTSDNCRNCETSGGDINSSNRLSLGNHPISREDFRGSDEISLRRCDNSEEPELSFPRNMSRSADSTALSIALPPRVQLDLPVGANRGADIGLPSPGNVKNPRLSYASFNSPVTSMGLLTPTSTSGHIQSPPHPPPVTAATFTAANSTSISPQSPHSPLGNPALYARSGSLTSQASIFSVCSETGERKPTGTRGNINCSNNNFALPIGLRNDTHYPNMPTPCSYTSLNQGTFPSTSSDLKGTVNGSCSANKPTSLLHLSQCNDESSKKNKVFSCDPGELRAAKADLRKTQGLQSHSHHSTNVTRGPAHNVGEEFALKESKSTVVPNKSCKKDPPILRHIRQQKTRPMSSPSIGLAPAPTPRGTDDSGGSQNSRNNSAERQKKVRSSYAGDSKMIFKQYGFIDNPEARSKAEHVSRGDPMDNASKGMSSSRDKSKYDSGRDSARTSPRKGPDHIPRSSSRSCPDNSRSRSGSQSRGSQTKPGIQATKGKNATLVDNVPNGQANDRVDSSYIRIHKSRSPHRRHKRKSIAKDSAVQTNLSGDETTESHRRPVSDHYINNNMTDEVDNGPITRNTIFPASTNEVCDNVPGLKNKSKTTVGDQSKDGWPQVVAQ